MNKKKIDYCYNCNSLVPVEQYNFSHEGEKRWLCTLCAGTFLSRATNQYVVMSTDMANLYMAVATITNALVDVLGVREKFEERLKIYFSDGDDE